MGGRSSRETGPTKRALLVGCNYPNTRSALKGCVADVELWRQFLTTSLGFDDANVTRLVDEGDDGLDRPIGRNIKRELRRIVAASSTGDVIFFHFSGYGTQIPADDEGDLEPDGLDETIVPSDLSLIVDDELRDIVSQLAPGVKFTMVADCGSSGGLLDHRRIHISGKTTEQEAQENATDGNPEMAILRSAPERRSRSLGQKSITALRQESIDAQNAIDEEEVTTRESDIDDPAILITACQSYETALEVTDEEGQSFGVFTHALINILSHQPPGSNRFLTYHDLIIKVRRLLRLSGLDQSPGLECTAAKAEENVFLD